MLVSLTALHSTCPDTGLWNRKSWDDFLKPLEMKDAHLHLLTFMENIDHTWQRIKADKSCIDTTWGQDSRGFLALGEAMVYSNLRLSISHSQLGQPSSP